MHLERIVPMGAMIMPFIWATGDSHSEFEAQVQAHSAVTEFLALDRFEENALYTIEWRGDPNDRIEGIGAVVVPDQRTNSGESGDDPADGE